MKHILFELLGTTIIVYTNFELAKEKKTQKVYSDPERRYSGTIDWVKTLKTDDTLYIFLNQVIKIDGVDYATISPREFRVEHYPAYNRNELFASVVALIVSNYKLDIEDLQIGEGRYWAGATLHPVFEFLK